jgi:hypothetical protein
MFHIVQPCANGPRRFDYATVLSSHLTIDDAFDELERVRAILGIHDLPALASDLAVVTADRSPIRARVQTTEATPALEVTSKRPSTANSRWKRNRRRTDNASEIRTSPVDSWDFVEPVLVERIALIPHKDGRLEVWRLEPDGTFSRMLTVEEDLEQLRRVEIATAPLTMPEPPAPRPAPPSVAKSQHARSWWSDHHVRIRWPKAVGPVVTIHGIKLQSALGLWRRDGRLGYGEQQTKHEAVAADHVGNDYEDPALRRA